MFTGPNRSFDASDASGRSEQSAPRAIWVGLTWRFGKAAREAS